MRGQRIGEECVKVFLGGSFTAPRARRVVACAIAHGEKALVTLNARLVEDTRRKNAERCLIGRVLDQFAVSFHEKSKVGESVPRECASGHIKL